MTADLRTRLDRLTTEWEAAEEPDGSTAYAPVLALAAELRALVDATPAHGTVRLVEAERDEVARAMLVGTYRDLPHAARERAKPVVEWIEARLAEQADHLAELVCSCTPEFRGFHGKHHADCPALKILREVTR